MPTPAGSFHTILNPDFWITTDLLAAIPDASDGRHDPVTNPMPQGWRLFDNHSKNVELDYQNPMIRIQTKDRGTLGFVSAGDMQVDVSVATQAPEFQDLLFSTGLRSSIAAAIAQRERLVMSAGNTAAAAVTVFVNLDTGTGVLTQFPVSIPANATAAGAADAIRGTAFTGYTTSGTPGTATVDFVANSTGRRVQATFQGAGSVAGAMTTPTRGRGQIDAAYQDPYWRYNFMVCIEGEVQEGGLFNRKKLARALFFNVTPAEEGGGGGRRGGGGGGRRRGGGGGRGGGADPGKMPWGWSGDDAWLPVALAIETLSNPDAGAKLTAANYPQAVHDPLGRHVLYFIDA